MLYYIKTVLCYCTYGLNTYYKNKVYVNYNYKFILEVD